MNHLTTPLNTIACGQKSYIILNNEDSFDVASASFRECHHMYVSYKNVGQPRANFADVLIS